MARVGLLLGPLFYRDDMLPTYASIHCELDIFGHCVDEIVKLVGHRSIPCQHLSNLAGNSNSASMLEQKTSGVAAAVVAAGSGSMLEKTM